MRIIVNKADVEVALKRLSEGSLKADISKVQLSKLVKDVKEEYKCGFEEDVFNCILDLNDSVGLNEYGITFPEL